eukprot:455381-Prymnesium_polylepis.1
MHKRTTQPNTRDWILLKLQHGAGIQRVTAVDTGGVRLQAVVGCGLRSWVALRTPQRSHLTSSRNG